MSKKGFIIPTVWMIVLLVGSLVTSPIIYDKMEETKVMDIPENNPITRGIETIGENMERIVTIDKVSFDVDRALERRYEYDKYLIPNIIPKINLEQGIICTMEYAPVCCNGVTYPNLCYAIGKGCIEGVVTNGECEEKCPNIPNIVCAYDPCPNQHIPDARGCVNCASPCKEIITIPKVTTTTTIKTECIVDSDCIPLGYNKCLNGVCYIVEEPIVSPKPSSDESECRTNGDCPQIICVTTPCPYYECYLGKCNYIIPKIIEKPTTSCTSDYNCVTLGYNKCLNGKCILIEFP